MTKNSNQKSNYKQKVEDGKHFQKQNKLLHWAHVYWQTIVIIGVNGVLLVGVILLMSGTITIPNIVGKNTNPMNTSSPEKTENSTKFAHPEPFQIDIPNAPADENPIQPDAYDLMSQKLKQLVLSQDPAAALNYMVANIATDKVIQENCHSLTHAVGDYALTKYNNSIADSMIYNVDICGGGYVHGLIEHFIGRSNNPSEELLTICAADDGTCWHGVGHGLMLVNKMQIPGSVSGCQSLRYAQAQTWCAEGVFMENFDSENVVASQKPYLDENNPTAICDTYYGVYKNACYYYSGRFIFKSNPDPKNALQLCKQHGDGGDKQACVRGMAAGIIRATLLTPSLMGEYCQSIPEYLSDCIQGAVNYHLLMLKDEQRTRAELCDAIERALQSNCYDLVDISPFR